MSSNSQSRVIIGLCMDKERDEELLNFLSSRKNKSEFIRNLLYENLENFKNRDDSFTSNSNALLSDISITLRNILFTLSNSNFSSNRSFTQDTSQSLYENNVVRNTGAIEEEANTEVQSEDDLILGAVADSFNGF